MEQNIDPLGNTLPTAPAAGLPDTVPGYCDIPCCHAPITVTEVDNHPGSNATQASMGIASGDQFHCLKLTNRIMHGALAKSASLVDIL